MNFKSIKAFVILSLGGMLMGFASPVMASANSNNISNNSTQVVNKDEESKINSMANTMADADKHMNFDKNGTLESIDVNYLAQKYGNLDKFQRINYIATKGYNAYISGKDLKIGQMSKASRGFVSCMKDELIDFVGGDIFTGGFSATIYGFIKHKAWQELAKLIWHFTKFDSPYVLVGELTYMSSKCFFTNI